VDSAGRLQGLVTQGDLLRALQADPAGEMSVLDAGTRSLVVTHPDESVFDAVTKMLENNIGRLPVVDRKDTRRMVGYINRASVMGSWRGHLHEESVREHGWFRNISSGVGHRGRGGAITGRVAGINAGEIRIALDLQANIVAEEFELTAPARGVFVGDEVRVDYRTDDRGRKVALRIVELSSRQ
jgi:CBS domain-containing protein